MKFRINFTYVYDVTPDMMPDGVVENPEDLIRAQIPHLDRIIADAINEKKKGVRLSVDLVEEVLPNRA